MASIYQHTPLQTSESIRLLKLSPESSNDAPTCCELIEVELNATTPAFEALSYTWGPEDPPHTILCGSSNSTLTVTPNCHMALRFLRDPKEVRTLWIDAICINQSDISERNAQVRKMGDIYSLASRVVIFLGDSDSESKALVELLKNKPKRSNEYVKDMEINRKIIHLLRAMFTRPWFSRMWIIQEFINASETIFICGEDAFQLMELKDLPHSGNSDEMAWYPAPVSLRFQLDHHKMIKNWRAIPDSNHGTEIFQIITSAAMSAATDPRDRALALVPLIKRLNSATAANTNSLDALVDYNKTFEQIYHDFTLILLSKIGLSIFYLVHRPESTNVPSWVPNWKIQQGSNGCGLDYETFFENFNESDLQKHFTVRSSATTNGDISANQELLVRGEQKGRIVELTPLFQNLPTDAAEYERSIKAVLEDVEGIKRGDKLSHLPDQSRKRLSYLEDDDIVTFLSQGYWDNSLAIGQGGFAKIADISKDAVLFLTSKNELGIARKGVELDDVLCYIRGTIAPCIMRKTNADKWRLIDGRCFHLETHFLVGEQKRLSTLAHWLIPNRCRAEEEFCIV